MLCPCNIAIITVVLGCHVFPIVAHAGHKISNIKSLKRIQTTHIWKVSPFTKTCNSGKLNQLELLGELYCITGCQQIFNTTACCHVTMVIFGDANQEQQLCLHKCYLIQKLLQCTRETQLISMHWSETPLEVWIVVGVLLMGLPYPHICHWQAWTLGRMPGTERSPKCWHRHRWDRSWDLCTHLHVLGEKVGHENNHLN